MTVGWLDKNNDLLHDDLEVLQLPLTVLIMPIAVPLNANGKNNGHSTGASLRAPSRRAGGRAG